MSEPLHTRGRIVQELTATVDSYYPAIETGQDPEAAAECIWDEVVEPALAKLRDEITDRANVEADLRAQLAEEKAKDHAH